MCYWAYLITKSQRPNENHIAQGMNCCGVTLWHNEPYSGLATFIGDQELSAIVLLLIPQSDKKRREADSGSVLGSTHHENISETV